MSDLEDLVNEDVETISFTTIAMAGDGRSKSYAALEEAKKGNFDEADQLLKEAVDSLNEAHLCQTALLTKEARGQHTDVDVILVHSQDHLMTAILANELIAELVALYRLNASK